MKALLQKHGEHVSEQRQRRQEFRRPPCPRPAILTSGFKCSTFGVRERLSSALDNCRLQFVPEILIKQLYKTYMGCLYGVGRG